MTLAMSTHRSQAQIPEYTSILRAIINMKAPVVQAELVGLCAGVDGVPRGGETTSIEQLYLHMGLRLGQGWARHPLRLTFPEIDYGGGDRALRQDDHRDTSEFTKRDAEDRETSGEGIYVAIAGLIPAYGTAKQGLLYIGVIGLHQTPTKPI